MGALIHSQRRASLAADPARCNSIYARGRNERPPKVAESRHLDCATFGLAIRIGLLVLLGYLALNVVAPFVTVILWSVVLAVALYPAFDGLRKSCIAAILAQIDYTCMLVSR